MYLHVRECLHTHIQSVHTCTYIKNICRRQGFSWSIYLNKIFTDTNPGIKKDHASNKTIFNIKVGTTDYYRYYRSSDESITSEIIKNT